MPGFSEFTRILRGPSSCEREQKCRQGGPRPQNAVRSPVFEQVRHAVDTRLWGRLRPPPWQLERGKHTLGLTEISPTQSAYREYGKTGGVS
jgi:hypothetical protein